MQNVKAYLRRGTARESLLHYKESAEGKNLDSHCLSVHLVWNPKGWHKFLGPHLIKWRLLIWIFSTPKMGPNLLKKMFTLYAVSCRKIQRSITDPEELLYTPMTWTFPRPISLSYMVCILNPYAMYIFFGQVNFGS